MWVSQKHQQIDTTMRLTTKNSFPNACRLSHFHQNWKKNAKNLPNAKNSQTLQTISQQNKIQIILPIAWSACMRSYHELNRQTKFLLSKHFCKWHIPRCISLCYTNNHALKTSKITLISPINNIQRRMLIQSDAIRWVTSSHMRQKLTIDIISTDAAVHRRKKTIPERITRLSSGTPTATEIAQANVKEKCLVFSPYKMLKWIAQVKIAQAKCERKMLRFSPHKMFKWDAGASVTIPLN